MPSLCFTFVLLKLCFDVLSSTNAAIIGAFVFPHGGIALSPSNFETQDPLAKQMAWQIHRSCVDVGQHIQELKPDLIVLSTPHGVADLTRFMFYLSQRGNGSATTDNCKCPPCCYSIDVKMDAQLSMQLVNDLQREGQNVSGLSFFAPPGDLEPSDLRWGEVIPLLFVKDLEHTKVVIVSHPSRRYEQSVEMIPELVELGRILYGQLDSRPEKIVVLISADLAHTHLASGPYGFSPDAAPFDKAVGNWAATLHPTYLLDVASRYVQNAKSCGYTGLVLLHGLLDAGQLSSWIPVLHANYHPDYYGMMVASFQRRELSNSLS